MLPNKDFQSGKITHRYVVIVSVARNIGGFDVSQNKILPQNLNSSYLNNGAISY